jgi:hypothetical protein
MDLLDQDSVDEFRNAMRDVTDTFHQTPVTLRQVSGTEIELLAGMKSDDAGSYGEVNGERYVQDEHSEMVERWIVTFHRDYLAEKELVDPTTGLLLINPEDWLIYKEKRYSIQILEDRAIFRGAPILVRLVVQR